MILAIILVVLAFVWLLVETRCLRVRLFVGHVDDIDRGVSIIDLVPILIFMGYMALVFRILKVSSSEAEIKGG